MRKCHFSQSVDYGLVWCPGQTEKKNSTSPFLPWMSQRTTKRLLNLLRWTAIRRQWAYHITSEVTDGKLITVTEFLIAKSFWENVAVSIHQNMYVHTVNYIDFIPFYTYHSRFISEGVAEASSLLLLNAYVLSKLFSYEK
jgi:hypothetical protein